MFVNKNYMPTALRTLLSNTVKSQALLDVTSPFGGAFTLFGVRRKEENQFVIADEVDDVELLSDLPNVLYCIVSNSE